MNSIGLNVVRSAISPDTPSLAEPPASENGDARVAVHASATVRSATSSPLESIVPAGGLHPIAESQAKRSVSLFLRRVWRDGALFGRGGTAGKDIAGEASRTR
jgi:hypothetical protein